MPNKYISKPGSTRGKWSEKGLQEAIEATKKGTSVRQASKLFSIPRKTLERRLKTGNATKGLMGPSCSLGLDNEERLVRHVKKIQKHGFLLTRDKLRTMAYNFAEQLGLKHKFNKEKGKAGYDWLQLFLSRHQDLSLRKPSTLYDNTNPDWAPSLSLGHEKHRNTKRNTKPRYERKLQQTQKIPEQAAASALLELGNDKKNTETNDMSNECDHSVGVQTDLTGHPMKAQLSHGVVPLQFKWSRKLSTEMSIKEKEANVEMITKRSSVNTRMLPFKCSPHSGEQAIQDLKESPGSSSSKGKWSNRGQKSKLKQIHAQRESKAKGITRGTSNGGDSDCSDEGTVADFPFLHVDMEQFAEEEPNCNDLVIKEHDVSEDFMKEEMDGMEEVVVKEEKDVDESLMDEDEFQVKVEDGSLNDIVKEEVEIDERLKEEPGGMPAEDCNVKEIKEWYVEGCTIKQEAEEGL